jgi:hypothetical protein
MDMMRPVSVALPPVKPDGLAATISWIGNTPTVNLSWNDNSIAETAYLVQRMGNGSGTWEDIGTIPSPLDQENTTGAKTIADTTVQVNTAYQYRVVAKNTVGYGGEFPAMTVQSTSDTLSVNTAPSAAAAPSNLAATAVSATQVNLTWTDNANNETGFRIERALVVNGTPGAFAALGAVAADVTTYSDATGTPNTTYAYRVFATNAAGDSLASNVATATTFDVAPAAPANLSAALQSAVQVGLTWSDNAANETGFRIERALVTGGTPGQYTTIGTVGANVTTYSDATVAPNTAYAYRVFAFNAIGDSLPSNVATVTTPAAGPAAPSNLTATLSFGPTRVQLSWRDNSNNENRFQVWRSTNGGAFTQIATVNRSNNQRNSTGGTVNYTNSNNLVSGNTYTYYVIAVNTVPNPDQASAPSNTASVTITLPTPPAAPSGLAGSAVRIPGSNQNDRATLTWTDNANNETGFLIQRSTSQNFNNANTYNVGANVTTFSQNVSRTQNFYYRVRATNAAGNSGWSNVVFVTTP